MAYNFSDVEKKKNEIVEWLSSEYRSIQTGRASPQVLDLVHVDLYGVRTPIAHTGSITIEDARTLRVSPWDKTAIGQMEKSINEASLGLSVASDDQGLRVHFPALTTETRQRLVKLLKERLEEARIRVRSLREEVNKDIDVRGKDGEYGEDDRLRYREDLQKLVDAVNAELESNFEKKEKEVMGD
jgi:ribosome recycling factor